MKPKHFFLKTTTIAGLTLLLAGCAAPAGLASAATEMRGWLPSFVSTDASSSGAATADQVAALHDVVTRANNEQVQAFSQNNPSLMQDTATAGYYRQLQQINADMQANGVTGISIDKIEWAAANVNGNTAQLTTYETWSTTYSDGSTDQSRDRNVYTLVNQNGAWKIQGDAHPDSAVEQPVPASQPSPTGRTRPTSNESSNWSGYEATGGNYTTVTGTWTVPQTDGSTGGADATWVGIGGVTSRDLIQAGTESDASGNGRVRYQAWIETLPQASHTVPLTVNPGDSVTVTIAEQSTDNWQVTLKDNTTGKSYQDTEQYQSSHSSAEWVEEAPSGGRRILPLDNFGTVNFTAASAIKDGQAENVSQLGGKAITMIDQAGQPIATPSAVGQDGQSFSVTRSQIDSGATTTTTGAPVPIVIPAGRGGRPGVSISIGGFGGF
ncbi:MAG: hypothetical protein JO247_13225 [Chloroflexi bacterium]|nr:hypothetical protein [Chloroflexota bacterium]